MTTIVDGTTGINAPAQTITGVSTLTGGFTVGATAAPAFSAYPSASATISSATYTKVILNTEDFDTASAFDSTTNYRFTPLVAGYYQINLVASTPQIAAANTNSFIVLYKNGSAYKYGGNQNSVGQQANSSWSGLVYLNGSTDYLEMYVYTSSASISLQSTYCNFSSFLARSA
jgi:hypothetical protein